MKVPTPLLLLFTASLTAARSQWHCDDYQETNKYCNPKLQFLLSSGTSEARLNSITASFTRGSSLCLLSTGYVDDDGDGDNDIFFKRIFAHYGNQEREIRDERDDGFDGVFERQGTTERNAAGQVTYRSSDSNVTDSQPAFIQRYEYDANGNQLLSDLTFSSGRTSKTTTTYNANGDVLTTTNSVNGLVNQVTENTYDEAGTLTTTDVYDGSGALTSTETYQYDGNNFLTSSTKVFSDGTSPDETTDYVRDAAGRVLETTFPIFGGVATETSTYYSDGLLAQLRAQITGSAIISDRTSTFFYPPNQPTWQGEGFWIRAEFLSATLEVVEDNLFSQGGRLLSQKRYVDGELTSQYEETKVETVSCEEETVEPVCTECGNFGGTQIKFKVWSICLDGCYLPFFARIAKAIGGVFSCGTC